MLQQTLPYLLALGSATFFSFASLLFTEISRKLSPVWMNVFKALVAWLCLGIVVLASRGNWAPLAGPHFFALFMSGLIGLGLGDIFLLLAYARMGAARTLILYGFQPLFVALLARLFLNGQELTWTAGVAIFFLLACLLSFSLEKYKQDGHWEITGLLAALVGVLMDSSGMIMSRWAFDQLPTLSAYQANFFRCSGALLFLFGFGFFQKIHFMAGWRKLNGKWKTLAVLSSVLGPFLGLVLLLWAIKIGQLASVTAVALAGPIMASAMECVYHRRLPTRYLIVALGFFIVGFILLLRA